MVMDMNMVKVINTVTDMVTDMEMDTDMDTGHIHWNCLNVVIFRNIRVRFR
jgi:hypothetical protein